MQTSNTTGFARYYLHACFLLMDAIATPTENGFKEALKLAKSADLAGYHTGPIQSAQLGSDHDLAVTLQMSITAAANFYGYRI